MVQAGVMLQHGGDQGGEGLDRRRAAILGRKNSARTLWGCCAACGPLSPDTEK